jgi:hypothetical protein
MNVFLANTKVEEYHKQLPERIRKYLKEKRLLSDEIISRFKIGWDGKAITIPIYNKENKFIFFKYRKDTEDTGEGPKYWYDEGSSAELYGWENLTHPKPFLIVCEGEFDRLILESRGIPAITSTGGAGTFKDEWISYLKEISNLYVCFDRDDAGLRNAQKLVEKLPNAKFISLSGLPEGKKDITDFFIVGHQIEDFNKLLKEAKTLDELNFWLGSLNSTEVIFLHPSQDFVDGIGYFCIPSLEYNKDSKVLFKQIYYIMTSERRLLRLDNPNEFYDKYKKYIKQLPLIKNPESHWTNKLINEYLFKGYTPLPLKVHQLIESIYRKYSEIKDEQWYSILPLFVIGTYFFYIFETYPYLAFEGIKNTGKSKTARITTRMSFNGILSVNASEATLYRDIEALRCTFGIDEAEILRDPEKSRMIRAILNAGHFKGAKVMRQEKTPKGEFYTKYYEVYSPKIIANIKGLEDALESRTIKIIMLRAKTEKGLILDTENSEDWNRIRHECYCFALIYFKNIREIYLNDPEVKIANNRDNDLWCPLLSIARFIFKDNLNRFREIKAFALEQIGLSQEESLDNYTNAFLQALKSLTSEGDSTCSTQDIKKNMEPYLEQEEFNSVTAKGIGWKLKSFGLRKKQRMGKGYIYQLKKKDIDDLVERYLEIPPLYPKRTTQTTRTTPKSLVSV